MAQFASDVLFSIDTALQLRNAVNVQSLPASNTELTYQSSTIQIVEAGTAGCSLQLPLKKNGVCFVVCNTSASNSLQVLNKEAGFLIVTLAANNSGSPAASTAIFWCDGSNWKAQIFNSHTASD